MVGDRLFVPNSELGKGRTWKTLPVDDDGGSFVVLSIGNALHTEPVAPLRITSWPWIVDRRACRQ